MRNLTYNEIKRAEDTLIEAWGDNGKRIIELIFNNAEENQLNMECAEFLQHCTACGGNWGGMLLTGIKALAPEVYEAIPDDMGVHAWGGITATLFLMKVEF